MHRLPLALSLLLILAGCANAPLPRQPVAVHRRQILRWHQNVWTVHQARGERAGPD
jgi:hypothetical protein